MLGIEYQGTVHVKRYEYNLARKIHYFKLLDEGVSFSIAASIVGIHIRTGRAWRNGRMQDGKYRLAFDKDMEYYKLMINYKEVEKGFTTNKHIRYEQRLLIAFCYNELHETYTQIAIRIGKHRTSVSREIERGLSENDMYDPYHAEDNFISKLPRPRQAKIHKYPLLYEYIEEKLKLHWSPKQIAQSLKVDIDFCLNIEYDKDMEICAETIYQAVYVQAKGKLKLEVEKMLRNGKVRRVSRATQERQHRFKDDMINIKDRPSEIEDRQIPGHWEADLIIGKDNHSAIGTLVERTTRYTMLLHLPNGYSADKVRDAMIDKLKEVSPSILKTLTYDQGSELARHKDIEKALDINIYFCDPHSPWQRGTNENTNRLLRDWFPKSTDLSVHSEEYLDYVADKLNERPRETLGFHTPKYQWNYFLTHGNIDTEDRRYWMRDKVKSVQ
jgi:IS30 family transposase